MKVLLLNYEFPPLGGGAANATYYLLKEFSKSKDLEIDLVTSSIDKHKIEKFSSNITIHFLNIGKKGNLHYQSNKDLLKYSWRAFWYSKKLLKQDHFNLVHAFFGIPCGYIAMKLGLPYIVSLRGSDVPFYNQRFKKLDKLIFQRLSRRIWKKAKAVIANSEGLRDLAQKTFKGKIDLIPNGVDTNEFKPLKNKPKSNKIRLISTGRLIERKGYQFLIPALRGLDQFELTLVGGGNYAVHLKELAKQYNVKINFVGEKKHKEVVKYLQTSDIFVLPSLNEGMSNSILEAMACGLPIITTNTGGSKELIKSNGLIVPTQSIKKLHNAILKLEDTRHQKAMSNQSIKLTQMLNWSNVAKNYLGIYKNA